MPVSFEKAFSIHDDAMLLRSRRSSILASNIANTDTPNYKARDIDFAESMRRAGQQQGNQLALSGKHKQHISSNGAQASDNVMYRNPLHASLDGNTVDSHVEQSKFAENALMFQTSFTLLNGRIKGLMLALKGE